MSGITEASTEVLDQPIIVTGPQEKSHRAAWWGVAALFLLHGIVVSTWVARIPAVKQSLGLTDGALGLALFGAAVGSVLGIPLCGWFVTRYGSRPAAVYSSILFPLALIGLAVAPNLAMLFAALFLYGIAAGATDVAMNSQAVSFEKLVNTSHISRFHAMFSLAAMAGAAAGGAIASRGIGTLPHLAGAAVVCLILLGATKGLLYDPHDPSKRDARLPLRQLPLALFALSAIGFCIFLSEGAIADWTAVYLQQVLNTGPGKAAMGYAIFSATMTIFRLTGDAISTRLGREATIFYGAMIASAGLLIVVTAPNANIAMPGFALAGVGYSSIIPLVFAAGGRIPGISEGAGVATVSGLGYLGFLVGPPMIGFVSEVSSLRIGLALLVLLGILSAALVRVAHPRHD